MKWYNGQIVEEEIITIVKIKHNDCGNSRNIAEKRLKEMLMADGYQVID